MRHQEFAASQDSHVCMDSVCLLSKAGDMACMPEPRLQLRLVQSFELCVVGIIQRLPALADRLLRGPNSLLPEGGRLVIPLGPSSLGLCSQTLLFRPVDGMRRVRREDAVGRCPCAHLYGSWATHT